MAFQATHDCTQCLAESDARDRLHILIRGGNPACVPDANGNPTHHWVRIQAPQVVMSDELQYLMPLLQSMWLQHPFFFMICEHIPITDMYAMTRLSDTSSDDRRVQYIRFMLKRFLDEQPAWRVEEEKDTTLLNLPFDENKADLEETVVRLHIIVTEAKMGTMSRLYRLLMENGVKKGYLRWNDTFGSKKLERIENNDDNSNVDYHSEKLIVNKSNNNKKNDKDEEEIVVFNEYYVVTQQSRLSNQQLLPALQREFNESRILTHNITFCRYFRDFTMCKLTKTQKRLYHRRINEITNDQGVLSNSLISSIFENENLKDAPNKNKNENKSKLFIETEERRKEQNATGIPHLGHKLLFEFPTNGMDNLSDQMSVLSDTENMTLMFDTSVFTSLYGIPTHNH